MDPYATSHFSNRALRVELKASDGGECKATAVMLSRLGEFDERKLFLEDAYPSMHAYCVGELNYTTEKASKRIYAARSARRFPVLFDAVADGRLNLSGVVMLAKYLRPGNVDGLLAAATRKTNDEIAQLIAERFPRPDLPERLGVIAPPPAPPLDVQDSARNADALFATARPCSGPAPEDSARNATATPLAPEPTQQHCAMNVEPRGRMTSLAPQRVAFQFTGDQETRELYEQFRALMSHGIPSGEMALVFKEALKIAVVERARRKFAATDRPGPSRGSANQRQFDHIEPVARGGASTVENLRLLCRAHNQHAAERKYGVQFMREKRAEARARTNARRGRPSTLITPASGSALPARCPRG